MATETDLLIWGYQRLEAEIRAKRKEIDTLRQMQQETKAKMPRLYFIEGFGQQGLEKGIIFAGTEEECKEWVAQQPEHEMAENGAQIRRKDVLQVGSYPVAGVIHEITPVDKGWQEISKLAELGKKPEGDSDVNE